MDKEKDKLTTFSLSIYGDITNYNEVLSKARCRIFYTGPNRNGTYITEEFANKLISTLPYVPVKGIYDTMKDDFTDHGRERYEGRIYGIVPENPNFAWESHLDVDGVERTYACTDVYLFTGLYKQEAFDIIQKSQSMELYADSIEGEWQFINGKRFFVFTEGRFLGLQALGEDYEPCFEGAQITKVQYSFEDSFKEQLFSLMNEIKTMLSEGGTSMTTDFEAKKPEEEKDEETCPECGKPLDECECKDKENEFCADCEHEETPAAEVEVPETEIETEEAPVEEFAAETCPECGKPIEECECEEDKKDKYVLDEIPEYVELRDKYAALENDYNEVVAARDALQSANAELTEFKASIEKKEKQAMIDSFYMLSDEDKKDVSDNIDIYSLDDIEAKLSIICVRNKVSFNLDDDKEDDTNPTTYNLNSGDQEETLVPAWVKAIQNNAK